MYYLRFAQIGPREVRPSRSACQGSCIVIGRVASINCVFYCGPKGSANNHPSKQVPGLARRGIWNAARLSMGYVSWEEVFVGPWVLNLGPCDVDRLGAPI